VSARPPGLSGWRDPSVLAAGGLALAAGFAQFGVTTVLAEVAAAFGQAPPGDGLAAEVGMAATQLGIGLAIIRLASLASLPVAGIADRLGRRRVALTCAAIGLAVTAAAALSPTFWVFVAIIAVARPLLTGTFSVANVIAAEETHVGARAAAIALVGAAYSLGSGVVAVTRGITGGALGFRGVLLMALVPLALLPLLGRAMRETPRFSAIGAGVVRHRLGAVPRPLVGRLALLSVLAVVLGFVVGPVFTYLFVYGEGVLGESPARMAWLVLAAGPVGLVGLLIGRCSADRVGRRPTAAFSTFIVGLGGLIAYRGSFAMLAAGYLVVIAAAAAFTPSGGALGAELFPTSVRATTAGWLSATGVLGSVTGLATFGVLADELGSFAEAATLLSVPALLAAALYLILPETRGRELEETAPEPES
jgi:MFS family permease